MRQLLLFRHAKSPSDDPSLSDHARPLSAAGRRTARLMRDGLGAAPELVLVSSARRTRQTLEALEPWPRDPAPEPERDPGPQVRVLDSLYLASGEQIMTVLRQVGDLAERVMVIGHNPGLHELALSLLGEPEPGATADAHRLAERFPTSAIAEFAVASTWAALRPGAGVRLLRFLCPRDLPEMAR